MLLNELGLSTLYHVQSSVLNEIQLHNVRLRIENYLNEFMNELFKIGMITHLH